MKDLKKQGMGNKKRKADSLEEDVNLLYDKNLLGAANPDALINTIYFNNSMHFGLRGRHEHEQMLWGDVELKKSANAQEYLEFTERATKTRNGTTGETRNFAPKMFSKPDDPLCPVRMYKEYKRRRPDEENQSTSRFYLQINRTTKSDKWYKRQPMGKNALGGLVKNMTEKAGITNKRLTNHSARKTTVTKLLDAGFQPTEIMQLTGHKNVQSINNYSSLSLDRQKYMSGALSSFASNKRVQQTATTTSSPPRGATVVESSVQEIDFYNSHDNDLQDVVQAINAVPGQNNFPNIEVPDHDSFPTANLPITVTNQGISVTSSGTLRKNPFSMFHNATINGNINMNFYGQQN